MNKIQGYNDSVYKSFANEGFSWKYIEKPTLIKLLSGKIDKETKILDAGCGEGRTIKLAVELGANQDNIVGVDISDELLNNLKSDFPNVKVVNSSIVEYCSNEKYDLVMSSMVLDYLSDEEFDKAIENFSTMLVDGGIFVFGISHPVREVYKINDLSHYLERSEWMDVTPWGDKVEYNHRPVSDYINKMIEKGLTIVRVEEPEIDEKGREDGDNYKKYSATPSRLFVMARK